MERATRDVSLHDCVDEARSWIETKCENRNNKCLQKLGGVDFCCGLRRKHADRDVQGRKFAKYFLNSLVHGAATSCTNYAQSYTPGAVSRRCIARFRSERRKTDVNNMMSLMVRRTLRLNAIMDYSDSICAQLTSDIAISRPWPSTVWIPKLIILLCYI